MKFLWIVNKCCGSYHEKRFGQKATGGQWLDAMLENAATSDDRIVVVNIEKNPSLTHYEDGNVTFYTLEGEPNERYDYKSAQSVEAWRAVLEKEKPDVIEIWGAEFPYALAAMKAAENIPSVVYVQGILDSIAKYYLSGLSDRELRIAVSLRDRLTGNTIRQAQKKYRARSAYEAEIVARSGHIIVENQWAASYYRKLCPTVTAHFLPISISDSFRVHHWSEESMCPHTIMCPAANYPIKGLHMLLKAVAILKKTYPDVKLYIPGTAPKRGNGLITKLKENGYDRLIKRMIAELGLSNTVVYTGRLTADEMAQKMSEVNCFAMTSAIENHSSTLKEAMTVGTPCVASYVGGVPEYAVDGKNCLLYRYEDYEVLAWQISRLFEDRELRVILSTAAMADMMRLDGPNDYEKMSAVLADLLRGAQA